MKLLELKLKNFKGIKNLELKANGENLKIFGDNATGKTTVYDAFLWLLFDKDSQNKSDFAIKTLDKDGVAISHLDHEVEGAFSVDGDTIVLRKVYREKWVKKRGSATEEFSGHETDHFIDGVPVTKTEYVAKIKEIAPETQFKLLTSPTFFNEQMKWQDRRQTLLEVCGDVSDEDVIKSNPELSGLPKILGKRSLEDHKKVVLARRTEINRELTQLPVRIDEVTKGLPELMTINYDIGKLTVAKTQKETELASLLNGGNAGEVKQKIAEIDAKLLDVETAYKRNFGQKVGEIEARIKGCQDNIRDTQRTISLKNVDIEHGKKLVETIEKRMVELRANWHEVNDREFEFWVDESCPTCGQNLPTDRVQDARDKALADFNTTKAKALEDANTEGKSKKAELEKTQSLIKTYLAEIEELEDSLALMAEDNAGLNGDLAKLKATEGDYKDLDNYKALVAERSKLQKQLDGEQVDVTPEKERIEAEIKELKDAESAVLEAKANLSLHEQGQRRITELKAQENVLATEFEKLEQELYLIEQFIRTKVSMLTDRINSKFEHARFKLFEEQVNGGLAEVCETTFGGVPYSSGLNNAARINVGLDIINTLSEHYGFTPPVFIDNAEAVTELIPVKGQLVSLIVSEKDKSLRIEGCEQAAMKEQTTLFEEAI